VSTLLGNTDGAFDIQMISQLEMHHSLVPVGDFKNN